MGGVMKALLLALLVVVTAATGCFVTKVVSVPMRVTGAVVSIVPGVGNTAHDAIDEAADSVDDLPF
jgi:hypothetical protein